ncbi:MAG: ABC transporter ATP-binding protein [Candidatus Aenigmatarchaeota archaeon]
MKPAIVIANLSKTFRERGKPVYALRNISLSVRKGEIFGLLGPNGSGKTTLINAMITLVKPEKGKVRLLGVDPYANRAVLSKTNYVPTASRAHWRQTPLDILVTYARLYGVKNPHERISKLIERFGISRFKRRMWYTLSTGEQARVRIAKGLINSPDVLLLDEPTLGLDPKSANAIRTELKRINRQTRLTIFLTSHNMNEISQLAHRIGFIKDGRLVHVGSVAAIKRRYGSLERYWMRMES